MNQKTRGTLSGLLKEGMIAKADGQTAPLPPDAPALMTTSAVDPSHYHLTESGFADLCFQFPFFRFLKDKWDGQWRIISYEIPESKREMRDRLRREMQGWGLGPWHRSFWLTPHPVIERLKNLIFGKEEEKYIQAFNASHAFGDREVLIEKVWETKKLDKQYRTLFKTWHDTLSEAAEKTDKFRKVVDGYVNLLKIDPGLPAELVGENYVGFEAYNIFKEIRTILLG
ncbi:hypothetical protein M1523_01410 [Patescibacteria group bacterium]|nr:hypothetical protein [Patescibacteria group bacterium]MCL5091562.1 hypothetical protein [Patescibacteria group bacterium]